MDCAYTKNKNNTYEFTDGTQVAIAYFLVRKNVR